VGISSSARNWRLTLTAASALVLIAACGSSPATPGASSGNAPTVVVQSPANDAVVAVGSNVTVSGTASDTVGVDHVALFADGVSVASSPSGTPAASVPFSLAWLATPAGPHVLQVIAYRADGTASDPAVINVVVGAAGSGLPVGSGLFSFPVTSVPPLITPPPTKKPKPSKMPTTPPTSTTATATPAATATATPATAPTPTPAGSPPLTPDPNGLAPDDTAIEPHLIEIVPLANNMGCQTGNVPIVEVGCIWERVSFPGDGTDMLYFVPQPNTSYKVEMSACDGETDSTEWFFPPKSEDTLPTGCGNWLITTTGATVGSNVMIQVDINQPPGQVYDLYLFTVYQCQFANCGSQ